MLSSGDPASTLGRTILFVAPAAYPLGGVAVWLNDVVPGLMDEGWAVEVALVAGRFHDFNEYCRWYPDIRAQAVFNPTGSAEGRVRALCSVITRSSPDVVVGVNIGDIFTSVNRVRRKGQVLKLAIALHGISADLLHDLKENASTVDAVICTNKLTSALVRSVAGLPAQRMFYAPCGVNIDKLRTASNLAPSKPLTIAWIGRLELSQKRIGDLHEVLSILDAKHVDFRLLIAGDGPERESTLASLKPWLMCGAVQYFGALRPNEVVANIYSRANALLITSSWETGPIVAWEAMAAGIPVVSSRFVGLSLEGALREGINCLTYEVGDCAGAASQLARLSQESGLRPRLISAAMSTVSARYALEQSNRSWHHGLTSAHALPARETANLLTPILPAGRLDRLLGISRAESLRRAARISFQHDSAGGEWPHSQSSNSDDETILAFARTLDDGNQSAP